MSVTLGTHLCSLCNRRVTYALDDDDDDDDNVLLTNQTYHSAVQIACNSALRQGTKTSTVVNGKIIYNTVNQYTATTR